MKNNKLYCAERKPSTELLWSWIKYHSLGMLHFCFIETYDMECIMENQIAV